MWTAVAILGMWIAVLIDAVWGADIVATSSSGDTTSFPAAIPIAFFVSIATVFVARYGFRSDDRPSPSSAAGLLDPGRQFERPLERRPVVDRLAVGHDDVLERQVEHGAQGREHALLVPRRAPDAEHSPALSERVGEDKRALLGEPERRFVPAAPVVERDQAPRQLAPGLDRLEVGFGDVVAPEEARAEGPDAR